MTRDRHSWFFIAFSISRKLLCKIGLAYCSMIHGLLRNSCLLAESKFKKFLSQGIVTIGVFWKYNLKSRLFEIFHGDQLFTFSSGTADKIDKYQVSPVDCSRSHLISHLWTLHWLRHWSFRYFSSRSWCLIYWSFTYQCFGCWCFRTVWFLSKSIEGKASTEIPSIFQFLGVRLNF